MLALNKGLVCSATTRIESVVIAIRQFTFANIIKEGRFLSPNLLADNKFTVP